MELGMYSLGVGDRFGRQGRAQLAAVMKAETAGVCVTPVWNKSNREHQIIGSAPDAVRREADAAVAALGWRHAWHVDADHIGAQTVDAFIAASDFFTLDVADFIGRTAETGATDAFAAAMDAHTGTLAIPGIAVSFDVSRATVRSIADRYLEAVREAGRLYRHIASLKGPGTFVTEVSMDETQTPQTPIELFFILAALAREGVPAQTIAPKFSGRFNKGIDYVGDPEQFAAEFRADVYVMKHATQVFDLPANLKLSIHSGSDKFALYPYIAETLRACGVGVHLKTAGTTWLEELIGLAEAGGDGLRIVQAVYREAWRRFDELCGPYATVIDIDRAALPAPATVDGWDGPRCVAALRHDRECPVFDPNLRQLLHVGYKIAAEMGTRYTDALETFASDIARNVTTNLFARHLRPLFLAAAH